MHAQQAHATGDREDKILSCSEQSALQCTLCIFTTLTSHLEAGRPGLLSQQALLACSRTGRCFQCRRNPEALCHPDRPPSCTKSCTSSTLWFRNSVNKVNALTETLTELFRQDRARWHAPADSLFHSRLRHASQTHRQTLNSPTGCPTPQRRESRQSTAFSSSAS